jgi:hypothetical protein
MAQLTGKRKRGRKPQRLRIVAAELASAVKAESGEVEVEVEVVPGEGRRKGETVTLTIPKGAVIVPLDLTGDKSPENVRQQLRNGASDVGAKVAIESHGGLTDAGEEFTLFVLKAAKGDDS